MIDNRYEIEIDAVSKSFEFISEGPRRQFRKIVPELDKYSNVVLFPEKVKQANELLKKAPIPKWILDQR